MLKILFVEGENSEVRDAVIELASTRPGHKYEVLLKKESYTQNLLKERGIKCRVCSQDGYKAPYLEGVEQLAQGTVDILFAGANIAHFTFLPILFRGISVHRSSDLLTSFALVEGTIDNKPRRIIMLDPTVVTNPTDEELSKMVINVNTAAKQLLGKAPTIALISHATGKDYPERTTKQSRVISILISKGLSNIISEPLQLDSALFEAVAEKKLSRISTLPNMLVLPDITSANILYKSFEHFGSEKIHVTCPLLWRASKGEVGLLPRTTTKEQILRSFDALVNMTRISRNINN